MARQSGRPVIAFSTDAGVATRGVYLLSFLAQAEVDRIIDYAAAQGKRSFAALIPETTYGSVVEAQFREAAARAGPARRAVERYAAGQPQAGGRAPRAADQRPGAAGRRPLRARQRRRLARRRQALQAARLQPAAGEAARHRRLERAARLRLRRASGRLVRGPRQPRLHTPSPSATGRATTPTRPASRRSPTTPFRSPRRSPARKARSASPKPVLTNPSGFAGADGVFRFKADGTNDRALAVQEIRGGAATTISAAPRALGASGT